MGFTQTIFLLAVVAILTAGIITKWGGHLEEARLKSGLECAFAETESCGVFWTKLSDRGNIARVRYDISAVTRDDREARIRELKQLGGKHNPDGEEVIFERMVSTDNVADYGRIFRYLINDGFEVVNGDEN